MNLLHYFFNWYQGSVWGNLLASAVIAVPAYLWGRFHVKKLHRRLDYHDAKLSLIHKHLKGQK